MNKLKSSIAYRLVWIANLLVKPPERELKYNYWPKFRPIDTCIEFQGSYQGHEYSCGAYSYEHLKSYSEQDGPNGACGKTTVAEFISDKGWKKLSDMEPREVQRSFAMIGLDMDDENMPGQQDISDIM